MFDWLGVTKDKMGLCYNGKRQHYLII